MSTLLRRVGNVYDQTHGDLRPKEAVSLIANKTGPRRGNPLWYTPTQCKNCQTMFEVYAGHKHWWGANLCRSCLHKTPELECDGCKNLKCREAYRPHSSSRTGLRSLCKECEKIQRAQPERREKAVLLEKRYRASLSDAKKKELREKNRGWWARTRLENPDRLLRYKGRSKKRTKARKEWSKAAWDRLCKGYDYKCLCCGKTFPSTELQKDHVYPVILGGQGYIENVQPLCKTCNCMKGRKYIDYRTELVHLW